MTGPFAHAADISRRSALTLLAAAGAGFAVFGPRGAKERSDGRIVLDYWEKWTGHEGRAMQDVVDEFNKSQDRIVVRYMVTAGVDQKALVAISGGDPPDLVGLYNYNVPLFAECNAVLPLDEFGSRYNFKLDNYAQAMQPILVHPDRTGKVRMWATTNTGGTLAMYYNRALFRSVGLDPDRPPRTIAELEAANAKLDLIDKDGTIQRVGFMQTEPGWWSWIWPYHFGGTLYDPATNRARLDSPESVASFAWVQARSKALDPGRSRTFRSGFATEYSSPRNAFLDGKAAMVIQGPWLANVIERFKPDLDYGVAPFPVVDAILDESKPVGLVESDVLMIPRGVKHPEACAEFLAYTQQQRVVEYLSKVHCKNSPLAHSSEDFLRTHPNRGVRVHDAIAKSPRGYLCPRTRVWLQMKDELDAGIQRIWTLERSAQSELADLNTRTQAFLDHAADERVRRGYFTPGGGGGTPS